MPTIQRKQVAGMNFHYRNYSLEYFLDLQQELGFESIELWGGAPHIWLDSMTLSNGKKICKKAEDRGLEIVAVKPENGFYQFQMAAQEERLYEKSFCYFKNGIQAASELDCKIIVINAGWGYLNEDRENAWKRSREMIFRLAEIARPLGLFLALESTPPEENGLVHTLSDVKRMCREIDHPNLKVMMDTSAVYSAGETMQAWFDAFGVQMIHIHFVDGNPSGHLVWGDGRQPLYDFISCLDQNHYTGCLGQYIAGDQYFENPEKADRRNMKNLERYF